MALIGVTGLSGAAELTLPALKLTGVVDSAGDRGHAIMLVDGKPQVVSRDESIGNGWRLTEIHSRYVLLSSGAVTVRLDLYSETPRSIDPAPNDPRERPSEPVVTHTLLTHPELELGQNRRIYQVTGAPGDSVEMDESIASHGSALEAGDPGMSRRFSDEPAPLALSNTDETWGNHAGDLDPGQSIRFGPLPPAEPERVDE